MMSQYNTFVGVSPERVKEIAEVMQEVQPHRVLCLSKVLKAQTMAPTKSRKNHKIKMEIELSPDAFPGPSAVTDFGAIVLLGIGKQHISKDFQPEEVEYLSTTEELAKTVASDVKQDAYDKEEILDLCSRVDANTKLYDIVRKYFMDKGVSCEESISQMDSVIEGAYEFMEDLFKVVEHTLPQEEDL